MSNPETGQTLDERQRTYYEPGSLTSGVYPYPDLEASSGGNDHQSADAGRQSSPTPTAGLRQAYHNVYPEPQWYYYPAHPLRFSSHLQAVPLSYPMSIPSTTALVNSPTDPVLASLKALQSQFAAFQESLGSVSLDVKDVLSQLHTLRTAQNKAEKCITTLEAVVGTGTRTRGRGTKSGKASTHMEPLLDAEGANVYVPEKTLIQNVASIQSTIEGLFAHENCTFQSHLSVNRRVTAASMPNVNPTGLKSAHISSTLGSPVCATACPSQSDSSSPLYSTAISSPEFIASQLYAVPRNVISFSSRAGRSLSMHDSLTNRLHYFSECLEYVDASDQASEPSCPSLHSHGHTPGFIPVDWNVDPVRPTPLTVENLAHSSLDVHLPNATASGQTSQRDSGALLRGSTASYIHSPIRTISTLTVLPSTSSSSNILTAPLASGTEPAMHSLSSPTRICAQNSLDQTPSTTAEAVDSSLGIGPCGDSLNLPTSPLSSLTSVSDTPMFLFGVSTPEEHPEKPQVELDSEDHRTTSDIDNNGISITSGVNIRTSESLPAAPLYRRQSSLVEASNEGLLSGLPTPPSETLPDGHEPQVDDRLTGEHSIATGRNLVSRAHLPRNVADISTPPSLVPEPSVQEDQRIGVQGSVRTFSGSPSPLTPLPLSPCLVVGNSLLGEAGGCMDVSRQSVAHTEEDADTFCDSGGTIVFGCDTPEGITAHGSSLTDLGVPVLNVTTKPPRSIAASNDDSSPVLPQVAMDPNLFMTPGSAGQSGIELPECHPDTDDVNSAYSRTDGYDFSLSSPWRRPSPPTSSTPSQHATPTDSSNSRPTQEEDEVWGALMLDTSGMSTPVQVYASPDLTFSYQPSRASSISPHSSQKFSTPVLEPLAVDPSMLHDPPLIPHGSELQSWPQGSEVSSLTSLAATDEDAERPSKRLRPSAASVVRAVSEATIGDGRAGLLPSGGPSASLSELALLARRDPLKIRLKLPRTMRGLKRKRDTDHGEGDDGERHEDNTDGDCMSSGANIPVSDALQKGQEGQEKGVLTGVSEIMPPSCIRAVTFAPNTSAPTVSQLTPEDLASGGSAIDPGQCPDVTLHLRVPRKRTKEHGEKEVHATLTASAHASIRRKKSKQAPKSSVKHHVWNGRIVYVKMRQEPEPTAAASSTSQLSIHTEETGQDLQPPVQLRHQKGGKNQAMKTLLSTPTSHPITPNPHFVRSPPTKEGVWNTICQGGKLWPELPIALSDWDIQFIQCDNCEKWYHYGCVAITSRDPRLEPGTLFICPRCHTQNTRRQSLRHSDDVCARPDCPAPQFTGDTEAYFVEKLVGRKAEGYIYMWLAKWEGYPISEATWIPEENVLGDGTKLFNDFVKDAEKEGTNLSQDVVLLQEALQAGLGG